MKNLLFISILLILSACVTSGYNLYGNLLTPQDSVLVEAAVKIEYDEHQKFTKYSAPIVQAKNFKDEYYLRGFLMDGDKSGGLFQIYIIVYTDDWLFIDKAYSKGNPLDLTVIEKEVGSCSSSFGCTLKEHIAINMTKSTLKRYEKSGLSFQISGNSGKREYDIPAGYFKGFLNAIDNKSMNKE